MCISDQCAAVVSCLLLLCFGCCHTLRALGSSTPSASPLACCEIVRALVGGLKHLPRSVFCPTQANKMQFRSPIRDCQKEVVVLSEGRAHFVGAKNTYAKKKPALCPPARPRTRPHAPLPARPHARTPARPHARMPACPHARMPARRTPAPPAPPVRTRTRAHAHRRTRARPRTHPHTWILSLGGVASCMLQSYGVLGLAPCHCTCRHAAGRVQHPTL